MAKDEGFSKEVTQRLPVGVRPTKVVDTSLAKTISLVGGHAMAAAKGHQKAKLVGSPEQELPTKEMVDVSSAPLEGFSDLPAAPDVEGATEIEITGGQEADPFETRTVLDPDVTLSFNQIAKARKQGILNADEAEARIIATTRAAINRMPGQAAEYKRAAGEFFGKFGPGGSTLRKTDAEQAVSAFIKEKTLQDLRDAETFRHTGTPVEEIQRIRGRAELAQYNKVVYAENLDKFTGESEVIVTAAMSKIVSDAFESISAQGNALSAQSRATLTVSLGAIRNAALQELTKSSGYQKADRTARDAAKNSINKIYDDYQAVFSDLNAAKIMTDMKTELSAGAHLHMASKFPDMYRRVAVYGPELENKLWEAAARNDDIFAAINSRDPTQIAKVKKWFIRYPEGRYLYEVQKQNREFYEKNILNDINNKTKDTLDKQRVDPEDPFAGSIMDNILSVFDSNSKVQPKSDASIAAVNTTINYGEEGDYLSLTKLATPAGRAHVIKTPGAIEQLQRLIESRLATDFNAIRSAGILAEPSPILDPEGSFDASSGFLGAVSRIRQRPDETLRAQLLEHSNLTIKLLNTYPEIWNKSYGSVEEFANAMFDKAKQDEETRRMLFEEQQATEESLTSTPISQEEAEAKLNIQELNADIDEVNRLIRERNG